MGFALAVRARRMRRGPVGRCSPQLGAGFEVWAPTYGGADYRKAALSGVAAALLPGDPWIRIRRHPIEDHVQDRAKWGTSGLKLRGNALQVLLSWAAV